MKNALEIVPVDHLDEVLPHALTHMPEAIEWDEAEAEAAAIAARNNETDGEGRVAH